MPGCSFSDGHLFFILRNHRRNQLFDIGNTRRISRVRTEEIPAGPYLLLLAACSIYF
jgi:hypothetical protein